MVYTFHHKDIVLEFCGNRGAILVLAESPADALTKAREIFSYMREENVTPRLAGEYLVQFRVRYNYRKALYKVIESAMRRLSTPELYASARYVDRYIVASIFELTGKPEFLASLNVQEEKGALRKSAVIAREAATAMRFVDYDISIHNFIELNSTSNHTSDVARSAASGVTRTKRSGHTR